MPGRRHVSTSALVLVGIAVAVALVVFVAPFADANPDGLEKVSADTGIDAAVSEHHLADGPLADYAVDGVDNSVLSTGLAGIAGIAVTFVVGAGVLWLVRRRRDRAGPVAA
ncbi:MAG: PDGLE domain-containing protein [Ilumatobacteraceae bacterium]